MPLRKMGEVYMLQSNLESTDCDQMLPRYLVGCRELLHKPFQVSDFFTIGSGTDNDIRLPSTEASPRHARLERKGRHHIIRDMRSGDGTFVNGVKVYEAELQEEDEIQIGEYRLRYVSNPAVLRLQALLSSRNEHWDSELKKLPQIAKMQFPILILGPSGSGKERIAEAIHENSGRAVHPLIAVNCSALTESLIESEFFGHMRGSFTGATHDRKGAFEAARGGTLFLDEIGDLPLSLQPKLLRALENHEIRPVGSDRTVKTDVRIVAATQQSLLQKVNKGDFRTDLYFRLNVIQISPPPLVQRMEDFDDIFYEFCKQYQVRFSQPAIELLKKHPWPGNIRELKNSVARAAARYGKSLVLPDHVSSLVESIGLTTFSGGEPSAITIR